MPRKGWVVVVVMLVLAAGAAAIGYLGWATARSASAETDQLRGQVEDLTASLRKASDRADQAEGILIGMDSVLSGATSDVEALDRELDRVARQVSELEAAPGSAPLPVPLVDVDSDVRLRDLESRVDNICRELRASPVASPGTPFIFC
jgi:hypothetical protein